MRSFFLRLSNFFRKEKLDRELQDELAAHLELHIADNLRSGMTPEAARRYALLKLGGLEQTKESVRDQRGFPLFESLLQDSRFALRMLRKSPAFTAVAVLTLALGIGANTSIFSLIDSLMLHTLPVRDPGDLVELLHRFPGEPELNGFSLESYQLMHDHNHVFCGLIAATHEPFQMRGDSFETQTVEGGYVDGTYFTVLGLSPAAGRLIGPEDDRANAPSAVAVVSWLFWKSKFDLDPTILGKQIVVENVPLTVVGVAPRGFIGLSEQFSQDIWLPLAMEPIIHHSVLGWGSLALVGRLSPGVSIEKARAEMKVLFRSDLQAPNPNPFLRNMNFEMEPAATGLSSPLRQQFTTPLLVLMVLVSLLLLVASSNMASLLLARGAAREHEMALRAALGASRARLVRLVLVEPLLLSAAGSLLAILLAYFGAGSLVRIILSGRPFVGLPLHVQIQVRPNLHVLLFTAAVALLTVVLSGLSPALRALGTAPASGLRQTGSIGEHRFRWLFGKSLVVAQVAFSVVLLSAAALFVGYLSNLENINLGFRRDHLLLVTLDPSKSGYKDAQLSGMYQELLGRMEAIPGVRSATLSAMTPISGSGQACYCVNVEGHEEKIENHRDLVSINRVAPRYFETYGTPLLAGREFTVQDRGGPRTAIINRTMARHYFGESSPIGKHLTFDLDEKPYEIVGVVGDAKYDDIREAPPRTIYLDTFQEGRIPSQFTLRTNVDPRTILSAVPQIVRTSLKTVDVAHVTTMDTQVDASIVPERLIVTLSGWFAALGAVLVAIGLYGLISFTVARRVSEIGVRMALGATRGDVSRMILGEALRMVCAGMVIGAPIAFWAKSFAAHLIPGLPSKSVIPIIFGAATMAAVALFSAYIPARRATRVDPMIALRYE
jgi:predicted permease